MRKEVTFCLSGESTVFEMLESRLGEKYLRLLYRVIRSRSRHRPNQIRTFRDLGAFREVCLWLEWGEEYSPFLRVLRCRIHAAGVVMANGRVDYIGPREFRATKC